MKRTGLFQIIVILVLAVFATALSAASAEASLYLQFADIEGGSMQENHQGWIEVNSVAWGVKVVGDPSFDFSNLSWNQTIDKSIPQIFEVLTNGSDIDQANVDFTYGPNDWVYFQMNFREVLIQELSLKGDSSTLASVAGSFSYRTIEMIYYELGPDGTPIGNYSAEYDLLSGGGSLGDLMLLYGMGLNGPQVVPIPAAVWLFGAGAAALVGLRRKIER